MSEKITFSWKGSLDPDSLSGQATYYFQDNNQLFVADFPSLVSAMHLHNFIESVYSFGKFDGARAIQLVVNKATHNILKE